MGVVKEHAIVKNRVLVRVQEVLSVVAHQMTIVIRQQIFVVVVTNDV